MTLTIDELESLDRVVDYCWESEKRDYDEQDAEGQDNHIFRDLEILNEALRRTTRPQ